jgi:hypothetical protein
MVDFAALVTAPCMEAFGADHAITFIPRGASTGFAIKGIFDRHGGSVTLEGNAVVTVRQPRLGVQMADFAAYPAEPQQGARVTIDGATWWVRDVQPDGIAGATLTLSARTASADDRP